MELLNFGNLAQSNLLENGRCNDHLFLNHPQSLLSNNGHVAFTKTNFPLRLLVRVSMVGAIIGKGGSTVKQIMQETNTNVYIYQLDNADKHDKLLSIHGSPCNASAACKKILEIIEKEEQKLNESNKLELKLIVHLSLIGRLIGKGGNTIKKIMESTNTKISTLAGPFLQNDNMSNCVIFVRGNLEDICEAEQKISLKLLYYYEKDLITAHSINNSRESMYLNGTIYPRLDGSSFTANISQNIFNQNHSPFLSQISPLSSFYNTTPIVNQNPSNNILLPIVNPSQMMPMPFQIAGLNSQFQNHNLNAHHQSPTFMLPASQLFPQLVEPWKLISHLPAQKEIVHLHVPSPLIGAVMGRKCLTIKEITKISGASITVESMYLNKNSETDDQDTIEKQLIKSTNNLVLTNKAESDEGSTSELNTYNTESSATSEISVPNESSEMNENSDQSSEKSQNKSRSKTINIENDMTFSRKITIVGSYEQRWKAQFLIFSRVSRMMCRNLHEICLKVEIYVPNSKVGTIIGKSGNTVRQIEALTGTSIMFGEELKNSDKTSAFIIGKFSGVQSAQKRIQEHIYKSTRNKKGKNANNSQVSQKTTQEVTKEEVKNAEDIESRSKSQSKEQETLNEKD